LNNVRLSAIRAIVVKDLLTLTPFVAVLVALILLQIFGERFDILPAAISAMATAVLPFLVLAALAVLVFAAFHQDPAVSFNHDWLTKPISKIELLVAKAVFLAIVALLPMAIGRFTANVLGGYGLGESALEATAFESAWAALLAPFLILIAAVTSSLLQAAGAILVVILVVFFVPMVLFPSFSTPNEYPNPDAIAEEWFSLGYDWILLAGLLAAFGILLIVVFWSQYSLRRTGLARALFALTAAACVAFVFEGVNWNMVYSVQRTAVPLSPSVPTDSINLSLEPGCFPASEVGEVASLAGSASGASRQIIGLPFWSPGRLRRAGSGAVTFATTLVARNLPDTWSVKVPRVKAVLSADSLDDDIALRPADYRPLGPSDANMTHFWLVPERLRRQLEGDPSTRLTLEYAVGFVELRSSVLAMDNRRRALPGLGYCSAERDSILNQVNVECFKRGPQPVEVSAGLIDVPASRVRSAPPSYAPAWLEVLGGRHYELTVDSPTLVSNDSIALTAHEARGFVEKTITTPGVLGDSMGRCPLPDADHATPRLTNWGDDSPHETRLVAVEDGVVLEVLDWRGAGRALVLLAGAGATAHSFDDFAPQLARDFRVIAITRRGFGVSSKPLHGYDIARLGADVVAVLDALAIDSPVLVGESLAGDELTEIGVRYPQRIAGLVYLDAAYDRTLEISDEYRAIMGTLPLAPRPQAADFASYETAKAYMDKVGMPHLPEGEILASFDLSRVGYVGSENSDPRIVQAIAAGLVKPDYAHVSVPALAIFATFGGAHDLSRPWYANDDPVTLAKLDRAFEIRSDFLAQHIGLFANGVPRAQVLELPGANHLVYVSNEEDVLAAIHRFVAAL
jgi:non-heme chloroperoxidase